VARPIPPGSPPQRLGRAWLTLPGERRLAAAACFGLLLSLFLPWYQETVIPTGFGGRSSLPSAVLTGWAAFSFVEAAVLLVAGCVLVLLFRRAEGHAFHVPGGDGGVITAAGVWTCLLIVWRIFDKQGTSGHGQFITTSGIEWGIFVALGVAALLAYAGTRIRLAHEPEPPLPGERVDPAASPPSPRSAPRGPRAPRVAPVGPQTLPQPRAPRARPSRPRRTFPELETIDLSEPPEPPTVRRRATPDDPLTARLDRED
jgi:hypothetical protein